MSASPDAAAAPVPALPAEPPTPLAGVQACLEQLHHTLAIAHGLLQAGRRVDLTGLDAEIGFVCARSLDLPPEDGRAARLGLIALRAQVEALWQALGPPGASPA